MINGSTAPIWLAMILAPQSRFTRWLVGRVPELLVALGLSYDMLLASGVARRGRMTNFLDPDAVRAALASHDIFLASWAHYLSFDLFVGRWIWDDSVSRGKPARLALALTWVAGPSGLSYYLLLGRRHA